MICGYIINIALVMKVGLLLIITLTITSLALYHISQQPRDDLFEEWVRTHRVAFEAPAQKYYRRAIFYRNYEKLQQHNMKNGQAYKMGINQFTIYSQQEFIQRFLSPKYLKTQSVESGINQEEVNVVIIDWVAKGAVGPVKNQGVCGSAALYSTIGGLQGLSKVSTGNLTIFSEQQLIDCVFGCSGSLISQGYSYYKAHGACTAEEYPNTGKAGTCQNKTCAFKISNYYTVNTCDSLAAAIMVEPVSVAVDASKWSVYSSGVFSNCGTALNHMVLLTGMADQYWTCKNSWGTAWGQKGYIRLARGNTCGICLSGVYPVK